MLDSLFTKNNSRHGFTMIEIMVVIVILGVLAGIGAPKLFGYTEKVKEKADLMKLYSLRDALNRALIENSEALYKCDYVTKGKDAANNLDSLKTKLASPTGVDLFIIEMHPTHPVNIQPSHSSINKNSKMSKLVGSSGIWYDALKDSGFEGVAEILNARNSGSSWQQSGNSYISQQYTASNGKEDYRTFPKNQIFMSRLLNHGKSAGLDKITSQGGNKTNYRVRMSFQWSGMDTTGHSVEVSLLPANANMLGSNGKGGALLSDNGVCFSTYGDIGCAEYYY